MRVSPQIGLRWRRGAATLVPVAIPLVMKVVFDETTRRWGSQRGYQAGFAIYWATCWAVAAAIVGLDRLVDLWRLPRDVVPRPRPVGVAVLVAPPLGAVVTEWWPNARASGPTAIAVAAGLGFTNALAEEALWRGVPLTTFPGEPLRGWLWPSVGFTAWHLVPLSARPTSARRRTFVLAGAAAIGLSYGWIAQRTQSLAVVTSAHALTDACGVRPVRTIWLTRS